MEKGCHVVDACAINDVTALMCFLCVMLPVYYKVSSSDADKPVIFVMTDFSKPSCSIAFAISRCFCAKVYPLSRTF